jgi:serpin B
MKILFGAFIGLLTFGQAAWAAQTDEQKLAAADNAFAFKLLQQITHSQPAANIFISPYGAATVLQMAANGAGGVTKAEMRQVLGISALPADSANAGAKAIASSLNNLDTNIILTTANALWYKSDFTVKPDFLDANRRFFDATIAPINFADPHAADMINAWAKEKTRGRISQIAEGMIDPVYSRLFLANAVYFKGKWSDPFKPEDTHNRPFHLRSGGQKDTPMMSQSKTFTYRHGTGYQAVRLPYEGENLAMYVFLPDTNSSPEKLLELMSGDRWQRVTKPGFIQKEGQVVLPKFKQEYSVELKPVLTGMGMKTAFDMKKADFTGIAPQLYISAALQKTFVEVKEEGTEAAAVTGFAVAASGIEMPPPDPFRMIVDRPFLFLIEDSQSGVILFMGVIFDPATD